MAGIQISKIKYSVVTPAKKKKKKDGKACILFRSITKTRLYNFAPLNLTFI